MDTDELHKLLTANVMKRIKTLNPHIAEILSKPVDKTMHGIIGRIQSRFDSLKYLAIRGKRKAIDTMLFRYENLPPFAKEYWFLHLDGLDPGLPRQMILCLIRFTSPARGNRRSLDGAQGIACWLFDEKKHILADTVCKASVEPDAIKSPVFNFTGKYPNYTLTIRKRGKTVSRLAFTERPRGRKYNFSKLFIGPFGYELVNLHLDFKGTINSKKISGKSLVQKVIATTPFLPWRWGHIRFSNGAELEYFLPSLEMLGLKYRFKSVLEFHYPDGRKTSLKDFEVNKDGPRWTVASADGRLSIGLRTYATSKFKFSSIGTFNYKQHFVRATDFCLKHGKKTQTLADMGAGSGIVEDAKGFLL